MRRPLLAAILAAVALAGCGGDGEDDPPLSSARAEPVADRPEQHVHGLAIDPDDGALLIATHAGLLRTERGASTAKRISRDAQDLMGFAIAPGGEYVASGHPAGDGAAALGYLRSTDDGRTFEPVALAGEADFHVLRLAGRRVYGAVPGSPAVYVSEDGGRSWGERRAPAEIVDAAVHPRAPDELLVATESGMARSTDGGGSWRYQSVTITGLLAWPAPGQVLLVDGTGTVHTSADVGRSWTVAGTIGGAPAAFAAHGGELYAALADGTVKQSSDGGRTWTVRLSVA
jgi:hypothetical protein